MKRAVAVIVAALVALLSMTATAAAHRNGDDDDGEFKCNGTFTGRTFDEIVVRPGKTCILIDSTVRDDVTVKRDAFLRATSTRIGDDVRGDRAQTVFIDTDSSVDGNVRTYKTNQVFVFNADVSGGIRVSRTSQVNGRVNICGNTIQGAGIAVVRSGTDILIGSNDPTTECAGNSVTRGSVLVAQNFTDVELVIQSNSVSRGSMYVLSNEGPAWADKLVQNNTGGRTLRCTGNDAPFVGSPNPGWQNYQGQCGP